MMCRKNCHFNFFLSLISLLYEKKTEIFKWLSQKIGNSFKRNWDDYKGDEVFLIVFYIDLCLLILEKNVLFFLMFQKFKCTVSCTSLRYSILNLKHNLRHKILFK